MYVCMCVCAIQNKSLQARYVYKTKQMFTNTLCLLNKNVHVSYVYKTKQKLTYKLYIYKTKYKTESLQNKTKIYIQVMFTKQNTKQKVYETKLKFTYKLCFTKLKYKTKVLHTSYVYKTSYV